LLLVLAPAAHGAIFGWTDSEGTAHFTNRESEIPPLYRDKARLIVHEPTDSQTPQEAGQPQASPQSAARLEAPPTGTAQAISNPEQKSARKVPGNKKSVGRHRKSQASAEEE